MRARSNGSEFKTHNEPLWSLEKSNDQRVSVSYIATVPLFVRVKINEFVIFFFLEQFVNCLNSILLPDTYGSDFRKAVRIESPYTEEYKERI